MNALRDFALGFAFLLLYEFLSLPLRAALAAAPMRGDIRRFLSRAAGPPLLAMAAWLAAHAGVPLGFGPALLWWTLFAGLGFACFRAAGGGGSLAAALAPIDRRRWKQDLALELAGVAIFFAFLWFRRAAPEMTSAGLNRAIGAEKFPNAMFFWSAWHARTLPLADYWLSGYAQAYYYWGHFFWAWVGRAGRFSGEIVITLAMARLVLLSWEASYLLMRAFGARVFASALGAFFIVFAGNPMAIKTANDSYRYASNRVTEPEAEHSFIFAPRYLKRAWENRKTFEDYFYWAPSRVIPNTVNEFPAWSAALGDFHAHHLSLPWLLAWLALAVRGDRWFGLRRGAGEGGAAPPGGARGMRVRAGIWFALFLALGVAAPISNLWIAPLVGLASFWIFFWRVPRGARWLILRGGAILILGAAIFGAAALSRGSLESPLPAAEAAAPGETPSFLAKLPVKPLPGTIRSTFNELFLLWGFHMLLVAAAAAAFCALRAAPLAPVACIGAAAAAILAKLLIMPNQPAFYGAALAALALAPGMGPRPWLRREVALMAALACALLAGLELFYLQDRMVGELSRYNSYFKFSYPVWPVLGASALLSAGRIWRAPGKRALRWPGRALVAALVPCALVFVAFGYPARNAQARRGDAGPRAPTLNAFAWLANVEGYKAEAEMLVWIRANVPPGEVVIEYADRVSGYNFSGRVASLGGRPVPLGWLHHEYQWRGAGAISPVEDNIRRAAAVYLARDAADLAAAAEKLRARWIVLASIERQKLGPAWDERLAFFAAHAKLRFSNTGAPGAIPPEPPAYVFELGGGAAEERGN